MVIVILLNTLVMTMDVYGSKVRLEHTHMFIGIHGLGLTQPYRVNPTLQVNPVCMHTHMCMCVCVDLSGYPIFVYMVMTMDVYGSKVRL